MFLCYVNTGADTDILLQNTRYTIVIFVNFVKMVKCLKFFFSFPFFFFFWLKFG